MAAIIKTIITTLTTITDADGALGYGTIRVRPAQEFEYTGTASDLFTVTTNAQEVVIAAGIISSGTLLLAPNTGAANSPSTSHYIVDLDINGVESRQYWRIDTADGGAGSQNIEFANVTRLPNAVGEGNSTDELLALNDPFPQYAKRSDTAQAATTYPNLTADSLDASLGQIVRANISTGHLPTDSVIAASIKADAVTTTKILDDAVTEAKIASGTKWFAGAQVSKLSPTPSDDPVISVAANKGGKSGNVNTTLTSTPSATEVTIDHSETGPYPTMYAKIVLPTGTTTDECTLIVNTDLTTKTNWSGTDSGILVVEPAAGSWTVYYLTSGNPDADEMDSWCFHFTILKHW